MGREFRVEEGGRTRRQGGGQGESVVQQVRVGFRDEEGDGGNEQRRMHDDGKDLVVELVNGIVRLWPAVPVR